MMGVGLSTKTDRSMWCTTMKDRHKSTIVLSLRLPTEVHQELVRRADNRGYPPSNWAAQIIRRELGRRPGEATRARAREQASN